MASSETLDNFEFGTSSFGARKGKWNWDEMLEKHSNKTEKVGKETLGTKEEGDPTPTTLQFMLRKQAAKRGLGIRITVKGQEVYYQALVLSDAEAAKVKADYEAKQEKWAEASKARKAAKTKGTSVKKDLADEFAANEQVVTETASEPNGDHEESSKPVESKKARKRREAAETAAKVMAE